MIMTTIGFGDVYPVTIGGRCVVTIISILILIIFSMLIETVINFCSFNFIEFNNFCYYLRIKIRENIKNSAQIFLK